MLVPQFLVQNPGIVAVKSGSSPIEWPLVRCISHTIHIPLLNNRIYGKSASMKAVELFAGIGGFRLAADYCQLDTVWANDICPLASRVYADRFGLEEHHEGDIAELIKTVPNHALLTAGFPCQPFSSAGKKKGIKDPRGTLFSKVVDVLAIHQPKFFVLENVKRLLSMERGVHFATILSSLAKLDYRIEWRLLNALHFGLPQNRERVFIVGVLDKGKSINPFLTRTRFRSCLASSSDLSDSKSFDLAAFHTPERWPLIENHSVKFPRWGVAWKDRFYAVTLPEFSERQDEVLLTNVLQNPADINGDFDFTKSTIERLKQSETVNRFVGGVQILSNQAGGARMGYTVFGIEGIAPTLTATPSRHYERYKIGKRYRRLTNIEYARLQGFPDDHCSKASVYMQYALYGNAVPPPMARWVLEQLESPGIPVCELPDRPTQKRLFADA